MNTSRPLRTLLASSLAGALILQGAVAYADDTEIFFGGNAIADGIRPNVLFLLDDSGSMAWCTDSDKTDTCKTASNQRMAVLKTTMTNLLDTTSGINAGLMVLNNRTGNNNYDPVTSPADPVLSRLLFPLTHIDAPYNLKLSSPEIKVSADDASRYDGATHISDPTLLMGYIKNPTSGTPQVLVRSLASDSPYSNNNATYYIKGSSNPIACSVKAGEESDNCDGPVNTINARSDSNGKDGLLLFRNLNLPKGVTIDKVTLTLTTDNNNSARDFNVRLLNSKTPGAFNDSAPIDGNRFSSVSRLTSSKPSNLVHNLDLTTMALALQSAAPIANPISDLAVRLRAVSNDNFRYAVGDSLSSPVLAIEYSGSENTQRSTGLRFQTVSVPQGATITSAKLAFVPAGSDNRPVSFLVTAEASDNAAQFAAGEDFTSRSKTAATPWNAPQWRTENPPVLNEGADVTAQVQSVVSRSGWCGNQAMAFFLTPNSGDGSRTAISQDGHNGLKPTLSVSYTGGDAGCIEPIAEVSLIDTKDDARQYFKPAAGWRDPENPAAVELNDNKLPFSDSGTNSTYTKTILGARFQKLPFKVGAQVLEASVIVTPDSAAGTQVTANVYFQRQSDSAGFTNTNDNLGSRTPLTDKTSCTFTSQGPGIPVTCQATSLASALQSSQPIIIVTIQTFPFVLQAIEKSASLKERCYAIIADEAHSSQTGSTARKLKEVLMVETKDEDEELSADDIIAAAVASRRVSTNLSYFAFTATPKAKTLELFGRLPKFDHQHCIENHLL